MTELIEIPEKIYLSQITLNLRSKAVRRDFGNIHDLHRSIMRAFPTEGHNGDKGRKAFKLLYRIETVNKKRPGYGKSQIFPKILVQSIVKPDWSSLPKDYFIHSDYGTPYHTKEISGEELLNALKNGSRFKFRLRANASKKISSATKEERLAGKKNKTKRVPLRKPEELVKWLIRKGNDAGFKLLKINKIDPEPKTIGFKKRSDSNNETRMKLVVEGALFEGVLEVIDIEKFLRAFIEGIGPGKSYGFGLLSLARHA